MSIRKTRIFTIFLPGFYEKKDKIFGQLQPLCPNIEFTGHVVLKGILDEKGKETAHQTIKAHLETLDGILIFGGLLDKRFTSLSLPVIMVRGIWIPGDWQKGIKSFYQGEKIITAALCDLDISEEISNARFKDLADKIKLIEVLSRIKEKKLLLVQEKEVLGQYDVFGMDYHVPLPDDYVERYSDHLKELGLRVEHIDLQNVLERIASVEKNAAQSIARQWIQSALDLNSDTNEQEVFEAAKLYLAMKSLMEEKNAEGIAIRSLVPWSKGTLRVTTCLPNTEFNKQLKVGVCEGLINAAVTELFGLLMFGRPSFIGDVIGIDPVQNLVTIAHCQSPVNPHGDDVVPYEIRSHALQKGNKMFPNVFPEIGKSLSATVRVELPTSEKVTLVKMSVYHKKIAVSTGMVVNGEEYYKDFKDRLCRTKIAVQLDAKAFEKNYDTVMFGVHRNVIYGDYRQTFQELANLLGYEIVEEDK